MMGIHWPVASCFENWLRLKLMDRRRSRRSRSMPLVAKFWQSESEQRQMLSSAPIISCPSWCLLTSCPKMPGDARDASAQFDPFHYFASPFFFGLGFFPRPEAALLLTIKTSFSVLSHNRKNQKQFLKIVIMEAQQSRN